MSYIRQERNIGGLGNINYAIKHNRNDYLVLFHDDDRMTSSMLSREYEFLENHPEAGCVSSLSSGFWPDGRVLEGKAHFDGECRIYEGRELFDTYFDKGETDTVCPSIMYRQELLDRHGLIFDPEVGPCCDLKLLFDMERYGHGVAVLNECLMQTRRHDGQDSTVNYFPMHIMLYKYLHDDEYYGPMLAGKTAFRDRKYKDFSKAILSLQIKGEKDKDILREWEKDLRHALGGRFADRVEYDVISRAASAFPGIAGKLYYGRKGDTGK